MILKEIKDAPKQPGIYKITSPTNKIYIGQAVNLNRRLKVYQSLNTVLQTQPKIFSSIQKYGSNNHQFEILELCDVNALDFLEQYHKQLHINLLGWEMSLFCKVNDLGSGPRSEDTIQKMKDSHIGKCHSTETKEKISKSLKGQKKTDEHIKNMSVSLKGREVWNKGIARTDEQKKYQSEKMKGRNKGQIAHNKKTVIQYTSEMVEVCKFESVRSAHNITGINPSPCLLGKNDKAGGYIWKYE
jgi:group I intron endonuclease